MRFFYILLFVLACSAECVASAVTKFGIADGLSNAFVTALAADKHGAVWVGTESGLNRIVGGHCEEYEPIDDIRTLFYDKRSDRLFAGTLGRGLYVVDCVSLNGSWLDVDAGLAGNDVASVSEASDGGVWIVLYNGKIQHYDSNAAKFRTYDFRSQAGHAGTTQACADDGRGNLYVGTSKGLGIMDIAGGKVAGMTVADGLPGNHVRAVFVDSRQNVWLATERGLAVAFPGRSGTSPAIVPVKVADGGVYGGGNVFCISETADRRLLVAADMGGVSMLELDEVRYGSRLSVSSDKLAGGAGGLSSLHARAVCQDSDGNIWVGHYGYGVDCVNTGRSAFRIIPVTSGGGVHSFAVASVARDNAGRMWIGFENMLALMEKGRVAKRWSVPSAGDSARVSVVRVFGDRYGNIWVGLADRGVVVFNPNTETFRAIDVGNIDAISFCQTAAGNVLIGTEKGLFCYKDSCLRHYGKLGKTIVTSILEDKSGRLWLGTMGRGLVVAKADGTPQDTFAVASGFCSDNVNMLVGAAENRIWAATYNGLACFDAHDSGISFSVYNDKVLGGKVYAVMPDRYGYIWASMNEGLLRLNPLTGEQVDFGRECGVPSGGMTLASAETTVGGMLCFGSTEGVCVFNPLAVRDMECGEVVPDDGYGIVKTLLAATAVVVLAALCVLGLKIRRKRSPGAGDKAGLCDGNGDCEDPEKMKMAELDKCFLLELTDIINNKMGEGHLEVSSLAGEMGMSHSSFYRRVKSLTGMTANEFVRKQRISKAADLLKDGYNISETMLQIGFSSSSYFRECFRSEYGMLPSEFVKKNRMASLKDF